jgi:hypothetical protein
LKFIPQYKILKRRLSTAGIFQPLFWDDGEVGMTSTDIGFRRTFGNRTETGRCGVPSLVGGRRAGLAAVHTLGLSSMDGLGGPGRLPPAW